MKKESNPPYICHVNTNEGDDTFVGLRSENGCIKVYFPIGYPLSNNIIEQKKDILLLIKTLSRYSTYLENLLPYSLSNNIENTNFPIHAYLTVLNEYYSRGYYTENEKTFSIDGNGSPNWARTIKTQKAYIQDDSVVYLTLISQKSKVNETSYITKINEFCVYEANNKIGFLFSSNKVKKPTIPFNEKQFIIVLKNRLRYENNDNNKRLLSSMIDIIQYVGKNDKNTNFFYGTNTFEYIWEKLIDFNFGIDNKNFYFPRTSWSLKEDGSYMKAALEPDTIMKVDNRIFILDAKYYRYGISRDPAKLPCSTSINKQITYGEYVATNSKFKVDGNNPCVFNVFLMPFNKNGEIFPSNENILYIGEASGEWKNSGASYEKVYGILLDLKWMMTKTIKQNQQDINQLAKLIENVISQNKIVHS